MATLAQAAASLANLELLHDLQVALVQRFKISDPHFFIKPSESFLPQYENEHLFNQEKKMQMLLKDDSPETQQLIKDILHEQTLANIVDSIKENNSIDKLSASELDFLLNNKEPKIKDFVGQYQAEIQTAFDQKRPANESAAPAA